jgi:hypothetical protein
LFSEPIFLAVPIPLVLIKFCSKVSSREEYFLGYDAQLVACLPYTCGYVVVNQPLITRITGNIKLANQELLWGIKNLSDKHHVCKADTLQLTSVAIKSQYCCRIKYWNGWLKRFLIRGPCFQ